MCSDKKLKIVFFGTPQFAANCLQYLLDNDVNIAAVITKPDRPQGRSLVCTPTPVKSVALAQTPPLPLFQPEIVSDVDFIPTLTQFQADLFVVVAYGEILKQHLLEMPKIACINLHASLLPKYRGAAPIQRAIINGETKSGVTIMHMVKKMDAGDIIAMESVAIPDEMTYGELEESLCRTGSRLLLQTINAFADGTPHQIPQDHEKATLAPKITMEDCKIKWDMQANEIHNLVRGVNPEPGAFCFAEIKGQRKRIRVIAARVAGITSDLSPGCILPGLKKELMVTCGKGTVLQILQLQQEGKKIMSAEEFVRGVAQGSILLS